jgi:hypothetical protein
MKINQTDYNDLRTAIADVLGNRTAAQVLELYHGNGLSEMRMRWDLLWHVSNIVRRPIFDRIYKYANDTHIDTALRRIVASL